MGLLRLARPANVVTAVSDILAGIAISGYLSPANTTGLSGLPIAALIISTMGLYGGGVVWNDVFDAALDAKERPERPIPSGTVTQTEAALWGGLLLFIGIISAGFVHPGFFSLSTILAIAIAVSALLYDKWFKHHFVAGPFAMGLCRGLNLLLGISIVPDVLLTYGLLGLVPIIYIAAITVISRGEVHGGGKKALYFALALYSIVIAALVAFAIPKGQLTTAVIFVAAFSAMIIPPLIKAIRQPIGPLIGRAVKSGVLALILMNAAWAAAFGLPYFACVIVLLLPLSLLLARLFAVT